MIHVLHLVFIKVSGFCVHCVISCMTVASSVPPTPRFSSLHTYYGLLLTASSFPWGMSFPDSQHVLWGEEGRMTHSCLEKNTLSAIHQWRYSPTRAHENMVWVLVSSDCRERAVFPFLPALEWWECKHELKSTGDRQSNCVWNSWVQTCLNLDPSLYFQLVDQ